MSFLLPGLSFGESWLEFDTQFQRKARQGPRLHAQRSWCLCLQSKNVQVQVTSENGSSLPLPNLSTDRLTRPPAPLLLCSFAAARSCFLIGQCQCGLLVQQGRRFTKVNTITITTNEVIPYKNLSLVSSFLSCILSMFFPCCFLGIAVVFLEDRRLFRKYPERRLEARNGEREEKRERDREREARALCAIGLTGYQRATGKREETERWIHPRSSFTFPSPLSQ